MTESEEELKSLLMRVKKESEKAGLKLKIQKLRSGHLVSSFHGKYLGKQWKQWRTLFLGLQNHCRRWLQPWNEKTLVPWKKTYDQPRNHIKKQKHYLANKGPSNQSYGFSSSHVWMWELDHKESWAPENWCFWTMVLEKALESPLDCKEIQPVNPRKSVLNNHRKDWCWSWNSNTLAT